MSEIHLIIGPMFSGKTSDLYITLSKLSYTHHNVCIITHENDGRYENSQSHMGVTLSLDHKIRSGNNLMAIYDMVSGYDVIGIDEGQFFEDLKEFCVCLLRNRKTIIYIAGLDGTFDQDIFPSIQKIIPLCTSIVKKTAICDMCRIRPASCTRRKTDQKDLIIVGGSEMYYPICLSCLMK